MDDNWRRTLHASRQRSVGDLYPPGIGKEYDEHEIIAPDFDLLQVPLTVTFNVP